MQRSVVEQFIDGTTQRTIVRERRAGDPRVFERVFEEGSGRELTPAERAAEPPRPLRFAYGVYRAKLSYAVDWETGREVVRERWFAVGRPRLLWETARDRYRPADGASVWGDSPLTAEALERGEPEGEGAERRVVRDFVDPRTGYRVVAAAPAGGGALVWRVFDGATGRELSLAERVRALPRRVVRTEPGREVRLRFAMDAERGCETVTTEVYGQRSGKLLRSASQSLYISRGDLESLAAADVLNRFGEREHRRFLSDEYPGWSRAKKVRYWAGQLALRTRMQPGGPYEIFHLGLRNHLFREDPHFAEILSDVLRMTVGRPTVAKLLLRHRAGSRSWRSIIDRLT